MTETHALISEKQRKLAIQILQDGFTSTVDRTAQLLADHDVKTLEEAAKELEKYPGKLGYVEAAETVRALAQRKVPGATSAAKDGDAT